MKAEELHLYHQGLLPGQGGVIPCELPADDEEPAHFMDTCPEPLSP